MKFTPELLILLSLILMMGCRNTKNLYNVPLPVFDKEGHRGCRGLMPENTLPAMIKAIELGVTTLEMDVVITKDQQVILSHEPFFNHEITTNADGSFIKEAEEKTYNIYTMTYAETRKFDVGKKPHPRFPKQQKLAVHKPLLADVIEDVLAHCATKKVAVPFFNIETKTNPSTDNTFHPAPDKFIELLMNVIDQKKIREKVIIQSFDFRTLQVLHKKFPSVKTAALIEDYDKRPLAEQLDSLGFLPTIYSPEVSLVNKELIEACHEQKIKVIPWTVNDKKRIGELKTIGVDGIITDYPDLFE